MKRTKHPTPGKPKGHRKKAAPIPKDTPAINPRHHPDAAGIDVGAEEFVAALPPQAAASKPCAPLPPAPAALESTGNYWIMLYDKLTEAGIDVYLVNARHVKGVPGKKIDGCDSQWLQQLHAAGLLRKSFSPALEIVPLRYLMRHRTELVEHAATQLHLMQKVLTEMNLKLHHVFSDIDGVSAGVLSILTSEVGTREQMLRAFPSAGAFASWLGLCPDNRVSGGKVLKAKTRKVPSRLARALRMAAFSLQRTEPQMGQMLRWFKGKLGKAEGITATAHKLVRVIYGVIKSQRSYDEQEASALGFALTQLPAAA